MDAVSEQAAALRREWETEPRWAGVRRDYTAEEVIRLRGSVIGEHAVARRGASRLWELLGSKDAVRALGAISGSQAVQQAKAGLQAIYLSGRHIAADSKAAGRTDSDQSLYPVNSLPQLVRRINLALMWADQISGPERPAGRAAPGQRRAAPIVAEAEGGFSSELDAFELMKAMIEAGAAGVHFDDQLSADKCGHLGEKVLIPTGQQVGALTAARLAADVLDVRSLIIARTHAQDAPLLTSDDDERDHEFMTGERTADGFCRVEPGRYARVTRALAFAPYADLLWLETSTPNLAEARAFATIIHSQYPDQLLAYSCAPSFNWGARTDDASIAKFQAELAAMGYRFQLISPAGVHAVNETMPEARARVLA
jgi:isocitrate lyase